MRTSFKTFWSSPCVSNSTLESSLDILKSRREYGSAKKIEIKMPEIEMFVHSLEIEIGVQMNEPNLNSNWPPFCKCISKAWRSAYRFQYALALKPLKCFGFMESVSSSPYDQSIFWKKESRNFHSKVNNSQKSYFHKVKEIWDSQRE